jgi:hypothetical protein
MLLKETTIAIFINGAPEDILIEPDGYEYHLFNNRVMVGDELGSLGSIIFVNDRWHYEGEQLTKDTQKEIAGYITNYRDDDYTLPYQTGGVTDNY